MDESAFKEIATKRRIALENIRKVITKYIPNAFPRACVQRETADVLDEILAMYKSVESGRDAFRDELLRLGYDHKKLVELVEKK